ncbi:MAG: hypothetical protein GX130_09325 [Candidatus Hydrogenedens sp.]|jgi:hypothetical protein|nr:hypothetical protein [Candidatus Hydrogenedens sp.]
MNMALLLASSVLAFQGVFSFEDDGSSLILRENDKAVWEFHYALVQPPFPVPAHYERACYFHPLYGLDGEIMTQDFPIDHFHHRGLFWAWPDSLAGEKKIDVWILKNARQRNLSRVEKEDDAERAVLSLVNHWAFDENPDQGIMKEEVEVIVYPAEDSHRAMDFTLTFTNVSDGTITLRGSGTDNKGYGGFCFRPDALRKNFIFTAATGRIEEDALALESPWVDISFPVVKGETALSGLAVFQHPDLPGFPHAGWILRHYGFLGQSWPHTQDHLMNPGDSFTLKYRVVLHRGSCEEADVPSLFQAYMTAQQSE